ncbi:MAG: ABC transporter permease [Gemmatimonadetes bacterium]|nr:ABC transporter permease [Gemmatimonadota bacterium]
MKAIDRKLVRDLWGMRGQALAIAFVVLAGVATYIAMRGIMAALQRSLTDYYEAYRFADGFATLRRAPEAARRQLLDIPGIAQLETRVTAPVRLDVPGFGEPVQGVLVSVPEGQQPLLNQLVLRAGRLVAPGHPDEVLLNEVFAQAQGLRPGDRLAATVNGRRRNFTVVGIALSPEYLLQMQPGTLFVDPARFGVLWLGREALAAACDMRGAFNDVTFSFAAGTRGQDVIERIDHVLARYGGRGAVLRKDQFSNFAIHEEFRQLRTTSTLLPGIFIAVAAFLLNIVVSRLISLQREQIGVLKAFGYTNTDVGLHYAKLVLLVALAGGAAGVVVGLWLAGLMGDLYLDYYRLPSLDFSASIGSVIAALVLTTGAALLGVQRAVRRAVRLSPAIAMRPALPALYHATIMERVGFQRWFDQPTRMILRNLDRQPVRALLTVVGIAFACAILVMGLFFGDSFDFIMRVQYGLAERQDVTVVFVEPTSTEAVHELARIPGVQWAEPFRSVAVRLRHGHRQYDASLEGVPTAARLRRIIGTDLEPIEIPAGGAVLTDRLAEVLHLRPGDSVTVEVREGSRRTRSVAVVGIARQFIGMAAYMDLGTLNRLAGAGQAVSGAHLMIDRPAEAAITAALQERPRVASILAQERAIEAFNEMVDRSMLTMTFILSLAAAVIAFGVVYNSARIALSERDRELASLRVLGFTRAEIAYILLGELTVLTLAAIPVGCLLGAAFSAWVVTSLQTDMYRFPIVLGRGTFGMAAAIVLGAAVVSALIVRYRLNRLDLIGVLKTRE